MIKINKKILKFIKNRRYLILGLIVGIAGFVSLFFKDINSASGLLLISTILFQQDDIVELKDKHEKLTNSVYEFNTYNLELFEKILGSKDNNKN